MNINFRRMFCVLVAAVLATVTLPAGADSPQKIFSLQLQLLSVTFDPPFTLKATITNRSPLKPSGRRPW